MKYVKLLSLAFILLLTHPDYSETLEVMNTKKWELELDIRLAPAFGFNYPSAKTGFHFENAEIQFSSEYDERLEFVMELDIQKLYIDPGSSSSVEIIEDLYLEYEFFNYLRLRAGQYKVPLGEEISRGVSERPYIEHSEGSKNLAPGRRQGLMVSGNNLFSFLDYRAGVFNTSGSETPENETAYVSTAGKLSAELIDNSFLDIDTGYSIYYSLDEIFAQSLFLDFTWDINDVHQLSLFSEYLEQRFYHYYWNNSIFLCLSYRPGNFEVYCSGELYDENTGHMDKDDSFILYSGFNYYWLKDRLKCSLGHRYVYEYQINEHEHWFTLFILWEH